MSFYQNSSTPSRRFRLVQASFLQEDGLAFAKVLPEEQIEKAFTDAHADFAREEGAVYTPAVTLWAFLSQVLFKEEQRSCMAAVSRVLVLLVALGRKPCLKNTGAYCRARGKLPGPVIRTLATDLAKGCEQAVPSEYPGYGHPDCILYFQYFTFDGQTEQDGGGLAVLGR